MFTYPQNWDNLIEKGNPDQVGMQITQITKYLRDTRREQNHVIWAARHMRNEIRIQISDSTTATEIFDNGVHEGRK